MLSLLGSQFTLPTCPLCPLCAPLVPLAGRGHAFREEEGQFVVIEVYRSSIFTRKVAHTGREDGSEERAGVF